MAPSRCFQDLVVWQKAHEFALGVYRITKGFPSEERFGLISQFRRAAVSVAANIAEGYKRRTSRDKAWFVTISQGSLEECRYFLILAKDLKYIDEITTLWNLSDEVGRLLNRYRSALLGRR